MRLTRSGIHYLTRTSQRGHIIVKTIILTIVNIPSQKTKEVWVEDPDQLQISEQSETLQLPFEEKGGAENPEINTEVAVVPLFISLKHKQCHLKQGEFTALLMNENL